MKQLDFQTMIDKYKEAPEKLEKRAHIQLLQNWLSRWSELEEAVAKTKKAFINKHIAGFEEVWTDLDDVVKQADQLVASFNALLPTSNALLPTSNDKSKRSSIFPWITDSQQQPRHYNSNKTGEGSSLRRKRFSEHPHKKEVSLRYTQDNASKGSCHKPSRASQLKQHQ